MAETWKYTSVSVWYNFIQKMNYEYTNKKILVLLKCTGFIIAVPNFDHIAVQ